jgi:cobalamin biosynthesis Mg chelatase CobN
MHLIATTTGVIDGAAEAVDLKQSPGEIVILSAADSELANLARAIDALDEGIPAVRLTNLMLLQHNYSVDLYCETTLAKAKLIVVRLLGGESYWPYGVASLRALAGQTGARLAILPGGSEPDPQTSSLSTLSLAETERLRQYFAHGGPANAIEALRYCALLVGHTGTSALPAPFRGADRYRETTATAPKAGIVFYRSVIEGGQTAPIDALCDALAARGMSVSALYIASLKDKASREQITTAWRDQPPDVIINATSFAVGDEAQDPLAGFDCPVLQVTLAGSGEVDWRQSTRGLGAKDLAMSMVLPELDGRIATRAISFKTDALWHAASECRIVTYKPVADRIEFVADLAANWAGLRHTPRQAQRSAIILANYPNKDGRIANGVGYDTPASTIAILQALSAAGHIQPARGYNIDPTASYHDPRPRAAARLSRRPISGCATTSARMPSSTMGKHGNLEWLPGKATGALADCYPEALWGPAAASLSLHRQRSGRGHAGQAPHPAVIIDHLTPPLTRAETYGPLKDLEALVDEYYRRLRHGPPPPRRPLPTHPRSRRDAGLDRDIGARARRPMRRCSARHLPLRPEGSADPRRPAHLRPVPHRPPRSRSARGAARVPARRTPAMPPSSAPWPTTWTRLRSADTAWAPWTGPQPDPAPPDGEGGASQPWATRWSTSKSSLGRRSRRRTPRAPEWTATRAVLATIETTIRPRLAACGPAEIARAARGPRWPFIAPGPSGAPSRGRLDVLPTGRNFYSVDNRAVPTPTAWELGRKSAENLLSGIFRITARRSLAGSQRLGHRQHAHRRRRHRAGLALIGASRLGPVLAARLRLRDHPAGRLGRPRVDVTLRISGFFRDAFPAQIDLFDSRHPRRRRPR